MTLQAEKLETVYRTPDIQSPGTRAGHLALVSEAIIEDRTLRQALTSSERMRQEVDNECYFGKDDIVVINE